MNKYLKLSLFSAAGIVTIGLVSSMLAEKESKSSEVAQASVPIRPMNMPNPGQQSGQEIKRPMIIEPSNQEKSPASVPIRPMEVVPGQQQPGQPGQAQAGQASSLTQEDIDMLEGRTPIPVVDEETGKEGTSARDSELTY